MDYFDEILKLVSRVLNTTLKQDSHHTCAINVHDKITMQMEFDREQENLILGASLGEIAPGKYREELLKEALRANSSYYPQFGALAYSARKRSLIYFFQMPLSNFRPEVLLDLLPHFIERAEMWTEQIKRGQIPQILPPSRSLPGSELPPGMLP